MWHKEFAHLGYRGWAESYFAEVQRKNQFTLPNALTVEEQDYLDTWRAKVQSLIERSASAVCRGHAMRPNPAVNSDAPVKVFVLVGVTGGTPVT